MYPDYVHALLSKDIYIENVDDILLEQTHLSYVFINDIYVYKIKKSVDFDFVKQSKLSQRKKFCLQEIEQNKRLAPKVYIKVVKIVLNIKSQYAIREGKIFKGDKIVEYAVKMHRLDLNNNLETILKNNNLPENFSKIFVDKIFSFHQKAVKFSGSKKTGGYLAEKNWCIDEMKQQKNHINFTISESLLKKITAYLNNFLLKNQAVFDLRLKEKNIIFGHGDLQIKHVYLENFFKSSKITVDDLLVIDCIEFSNLFHFKFIDKGYDIAFLTMGMDYSHNPQIADEICGHYVALTGDKYFGILHNYHKILRALIRAKVEGIAAKSDIIDKLARKKYKQQSKIFFQLVKKYIEIPSDPLVIVVGGFSASGKSTFAGALASRLGAAYVSSDVIRKKMFNVDIHHRPSKSITQKMYNSNVTVQVYSKLLKEASMLMKQNFSVVIDAAYLLKSERDITNQFIQESSLPSFFLWLDASENVINSRVKARTSTQLKISDANIGIINKQFKSFEKINENEKIYIINNNKTMHNSFLQVSKISKLLKDKIIF